MEWVAVDSEPEGLRYLMLACRVRKVVDKHMIGSDLSLARWKVLEILEGGGRDSAPADGAVRRRSSKVLPARVTHPLARVATADAHRYAPPAAVHTYRLAGIWTRRTGELQLAGMRSGAGTVEAVCMSLDELPDALPNR